MSPSVTLDCFIEKSRRLYSLPAVAMEVLELTSQPQVDIRALKQCIENDPALTSKVLRVVNSSLFGLGCEVVDLNQALALLGTNPLKLLVLGFSLSGAMFTQISGAAADRYWRHTLTKAVTARELSEQVWQRPGDEAFIAALLEDVGMLVLLQELGESYARIVTQAAASDVPLTQLEAEALGFDHRQLTARLLDEWHLPESLVKTIRRAPYPQEVACLPPAERAAPSTVYLAGLIADLFVDSRRAALQTLFHNGLAHHELTPERLVAIVRELQGKVEQLAAVLNLTLPTGCDTRDVLAMAQQQMADIAEESAFDRVRPAFNDAQTDRIAQMWDDVRSLNAAATRLTGPRESGVAAAAPSASVAHAVPHRVAMVESATYIARPGIEQEAGLLERLTAAVAACRQSRSPLSLVLVEIDDFKKLALKVGPVEAEQLAIQLGAVCRDVDHAHAVCVQTHEARFGLVLGNCDRSQAVEIGGQLVGQARSLLPLQQIDTLGPLTVSVGVATVELAAKNFQSAHLAESAGRCLAAAQLSGGNRLKSIDVY